MGISDKSGNWPIYLRRDQVALNNQWEFKNWSWINIVRERKIRRDKEKNRSHWRLVSIRKKWKGWLWKCIQKSLITFIFKHEGQKCSDWLDVKYQRNISIKERKVYGHCFIDC